MNPSRRIQDYITDCLTYGDEVACLNSLETLGVIRYGSFDFVEGLSLARIINHWIYLRFKMKLPAAS